MLFSSFAPAQASMGAWRLLNPTEYTANPASDLHGVYMLSGSIGSKQSPPPLGWAVGDNGLIFAWDGFSWIQQPSITDCQLNAVNFGGPTNPLTGTTSASGWIVGGDISPGAGAGCGVSKNAVALYFGGGVPVSYPVPNTMHPGKKAEIRSVSVVKIASSLGDTVDAWAAGAEDTFGEFWHWSGVPGSGGAWSDLQTVDPNPAIESIYMTHCTGSPCTADDGIAVGDGGGTTNIYHYTGSWTALPTPDSTVTLYGVAMASQTQGWAVGKTAGGNCAMFRTTDGTTWTGPFSPGGCAGVALRSIVLLSSSEGWAVGDAGVNGATVLHGTSLDSSPTWTPIPATQLTTQLSLNSVTFAVSGGNLWAVGQGGVAAFCISNCGSQSGSIWSTTTAPQNKFGGSPVALNSVFMDSDSDGWAVGGLDNVGGTVTPTVLRWDGGTFSWTRSPSVSPNPVAPMYSVFMSGGSDAWAVGGTDPAGVPSTMYYDGNTWSGKTVGCAGPCPPFEFRSVYMVSGSQSWAVGGCPSAGPSCSGPHRGVIMQSTSTGGQFGSASTAPAIATNDLYAVYFDPTSGGQSGWVAGGNGAGFSPVLAHTANGGTDAWAAKILVSGADWTAQTGLPLTGVILKTLFFQDSTHGWAAGVDTSGTLKSVILFWNGISWTLSPVLGIPGADVLDIRGIFVDSSTDGWAVGVDTTSNTPVTIFYNGGAWTDVSLSPPIPPPGGLSPLNGVYVRSDTNGLAVGSNIGGSINSLGLILHLDPPSGAGGGGGGGTTTATTSTTSTSIVTSTSVVSTTSATSTSSTASSASTTSSASASSSSTSSTQTGSTQVATITVQSTVTTSSSSAASTSSTASTPLALPPIPGFPVESILAGIAVGLAALAIVRRRRKTGRLPK